MSDEAKFLLARISEDERLAEHAKQKNGASWATYAVANGLAVTGLAIQGKPGPDGLDDDGSLWEHENVSGIKSETAAHIVNWDPARVLVDCAARRQLVLHLDSDEANTLLRVLLQPFSAHPGFDPRWLGLD